MQLLRSQPSTTMPELHRWTPQPHQSPWYNHTGWLGIKHLKSYLSPTSLPIFFKGSEKYQFFCLFCFLMWPLLNCNCRLQLLNPWCNIVVIRTKSAKGKDGSHLARQPSYRRLTHTSNCTDQGAWSSFENSMGTCFVYITMEMYTLQARLRSLYTPTG